jgi:hypothetical protein
MVQLGSSVAFLKAADVKQGQMAKILDEGGWEESSKFKNEDGTPQSSFYVLVEVNGQSRKLKFNKASRDECIKAWGRETKDWVGKEISLSTYPTPQGQKTIGVTPIAWE